MLPVCQKRSRKEISDPNLSAANVLKQMFKQAEAEGKDHQQGRLR
jgi:hypothetical protein